MHGGSCSHGSDLRIKLCAPAPYHRPTSSDEGEHAADQEQTARPGQVRPAEAWHTEPNQHYARGDQTGDLMRSVAANDRTKQETGPDQEYEL